MGPDVLALADAKLLEAARDPGPSRHNDAASTNPGRP